MKKQQQRNCLLAWNEYGTSYSPAGLFLSPVLLLHNRCAHGGYRADSLLFQKQDSQCMQETEHEQDLANETSQLHCHEFCVSWLHGAW